MSMTIPANMFEPAVLSLAILCKDIATADVPAAAVADAPSPLKS